MNSNTIKILLVGDVMIGRSFNQIFQNNPEHQAKIWGNCLPIMQNHDLVVGNLETTLTNSTTKWPNKTFNYQLDPKWANTLSIGNFHYLSLANNHILDFQVPGLLETQNTLNQLNIGWAGAGINLGEAQSPHFLSIKNNIIGFLSAADHYSYWAANNNQAGIWYLPILDLGSQFYYSKYWENIKNVVKETRKRCDYLIFSLHWGPNYVDYVNPLYKKFAHSLIDLGIDIIHGHSAHHVLPVERYKNGLIFYSMGDFIDDYAIDPIYRNDLAFMASITLPIKTKNINQHPNTNKIDYKMYPTIISKYTVNLR